MCDPLSIYDIATNVQQQRCSYVTVQYEVLHTCWGSHSLSSAQAACNQLVCAGNMSKQSASMLRSLSCLQTETSPKTSYSCEHLKFQQKLICKQNKRQGGQVVAPTCSLAQSVLDTNVDSNTQVTIVGEAHLEAMSLKEAFSSCLSKKGSRQELCTA